MSHTWGESSCGAPKLASYWRSVTTYDVTAMPPGSAHYSLCCNDEGGIEDDIMVYRLVEDRWLVVHNGRERRSGVGAA